MDITLEHLVGSACYLYKVDSDFTRLVDGSIRDTGIDYCRLGQLAIRYCHGMECDVTDYALQRSKLFSARSDVLLQECLLDPWLSYYRYFVLKG